VASGFRDFIQLEPFTSTLFPAPAPEDSGAASHHGAQDCKSVWGKSLTMFPIMSFIIPNMSMKPPDCSKEMEARVRKAPSVLRWSPLGTL